MIFKILVLYLFCVTCILCRSNSNEQLVKEKYVDEDSHFANHPPLEGKEIPVQVVYDEVTVVTIKPKKESRTLRSRGNIRYSNTINKESENDVPEKKLTTNPSRSTSRLPTTMKAITTPTSTVAVPTKLKTTQRTNIITAIPVTEKQVINEIPVGTAINNKATNKVSESKLTTLSSQSGTRLILSTTKITTTARPIEIKMTESNNIKSMESDTEKSKPINEIPVPIVDNTAKKEVQENKLNILPSQSSITESPTTRKATLTSSTTAVPIDVNTTASNIIIQSSETTKYPTKKTKNIDLQVPVSIVIDDTVHKVKSRAKQQTQKLVVKSTTEKDIIKRPEETSETTAVPKTIDQGSSKNTPDKNIDIHSTTKIVENSTRQSKYIRQRDPIVPIIESDNQIYSHIGKFNYSYEGGDGTKSYQSGILKGVDESHMGEAVVGGFSYKDEDGKDVMLSYTADENGYRPVGAHLPTPPPIPPAIARALLYLATKTTPEPVTKSTLDAN